MTDCVCKFYRYLPRPLEQTQALMQSVTWEEDLISRHGRQSQVSHKCVIYMEGAGDGDSG